MHHTSKHRRCTPTALVRNSPDKSVVEHSYAKDTSSLITLNLALESPDSRASFYLYLDYGNGDGVDYTYNKNNHVSRIEENTGEKQRVTTFVYDDDDRIYTTRKGSSRRVYSYDDYSRVSGKTAQHVDTTDLNVLEETFTYRNPVEDGATSQVETYRTASPAGYDVTYSYTYDGNGNILTVSDGTNTTSYVYDTANQLLRENNQAAGKTWGNC